mmetsp:Transcript_99513/g.259963  ORF Transcript_99513/g.259963 Transcript_99513/m.259963 type:complete len:427 (+) Transcript_99513:316-1596(+)
MSSLTGTSGSSGDVSARFSQVLSSCADLLARAVADIPADSPPPEDELTTVAMETKEQRLQWRDFLSEAVSKSCAQSLFAAFDVEAEPPRYRRPPRSAPVPAAHAVDSGEANADQEIGWGDGGSVASGAQAASGLSEGPGEAATIAAEQAKRVAAAAVAYVAETSGTSGSGPLLGLVEPFPVHSRMHSRLERVPEEPPSPPLVAPRGAGWSPLPPGPCRRQPPTSSSKPRRTPTLFDECESPPPPRQLAGHRMQPQPHRLWIDSDTCGMPSIPAAVAAAGHGDPGGWWAFGGHRGPQLAPETPMHPVSENCITSDSLGLPVARQPSVQPWEPSAGASSSADPVSTGVATSTSVDGYGNSGPSVQEASLTNIEGPCCTTSTAAVIEADTAALGVPSCSGVAEEREHWPPHIGWPQALVAVPGAPARAG